MKTAALVLFAKNPELSPVKTRLAKTIGPDLAGEFYQHSLRVTLNLMESLSDVAQGFVAVAEEGEGHGFWSGKKRSFLLIDQGEGGLGERLSKVYAELIEQFQSVVFIGADSPHLPMRILLQAFKSLDSSSTDFLLGKTLDGGFYLFGGRKSVPKDLWTAVPYSQSSTSEILMGNLQSRGSVLQVEENFDVDTVEDLLRYENWDLEGLNSDQLELINWVRLKNFQV